MCWSKRSVPDFSTVTTTAFTPTVSSTVDNTPVYCHYPAVECSQNATDRYCSFSGKCCERDATPIYCVCVEGYTGRFCETQRLDPWLLESQEASTTIGIAIGVSVFFMMVLVALVVSLVLFRRKNNQNRSEREEEQLKKAEAIQTPVDHNSNSKNSTSCEESESCLPDKLESNHTNTKSTVK